MSSESKKTVFISGKTLSGCQELIDILEQKGFKAVKKYSHDNFSAEENSLLISESPPVHQHDCCGNHDAIQSEQRYRLLFEYSPLGIFQADHNGLIIDCNNNFVKIIGSSRQQLIGISLFDLPDEKLVAEISATLEGGVGFYEDVYHSVTADKKTPVRINLAPLFDKDDKVLGLVGIVEDMSSSKNVEDALRKSKESLKEKNALFQGILDNVPDLMSVKYPDLRIIMYNKAGYEFLNLSHEEVLGKKCFELMNRSAPCRPCAGLEAVAKKKPASNEKYIPELDKYLRCQANPILGDDGRVAYIVELIRDVTDRIKREKELQESQERFVKAFRSSPAPQVISDIETGQIIDANDRWVEMLGWTMDEQIGRTSKDIGIWDNPVDRDRVVAKLKAKGSFKEMPIKFRTKQGNTIMALWSGEAVTLGGRRVMLSMIYDETERRLAEDEKERLQAQLLQSQKMESMGILAGGVAHDFNNILQTMGGNIQLLLVDKDDQNPDLKKLKTIQKSINRAAQLIKQLLVFSRKAESSRKIMNLNKEVEDAVKILKRTLPRMIEIDENLDENLWSINADPVQMEQVLLNIGFNASDAMPDGGRMIIETENIFLKPEDSKRYFGISPGPYIHMNVSDPGLGMDRETVKHIFEPFYTTKEIGKGTGLGLASVYGIIKEHNGQIFCYSEPGQGTSFKVYLPALDKET
ncbi:MAG: PAS domain S-box protein, partial [Desulfonatronovibrio sp.]